MKNLVLKIPDAVDLDENEDLMILASRLYEQGKLTLGQAAEMAGLTKRSFMESLGKYGVSVFNYPASDLDRDIENEKNYNI
jgi:predicted HTH domain antitoxin